MPAPAAMRLPAASTPMSFMVTPAVGQGAEGGLGGQVDRVLVGVLAELGHVDPEDPDVVACHRQSGLLRAASKPKPTASVPAPSVPIGNVVSRTFMPELHVLGVGLDVDDVAPHAGAVAVDDRGHERHRDAGRGERHDGEGPHLALGGDLDRARSRCRRRRRRRCGGRRTGRRTPCTRWPRGAGRRPAPGSRPTGPARSRWFPFQWRLAGGQSTHRVSSICKPVWGDHHADRHHRRPPDPGRHGGRVPGEADARAAARALLEGRPRACPRSGASWSGSAGWACTCPRSTAARATGSPSWSSWWRSWAGRGAGSVRAHGHRRRRPSPGRRRRQRGRCCPAWPTARGGRRSALGGGRRLARGAPRAARRVSAAAWPTCCWSWRPATTSSWSAERRRVTVDVPRQPRPDPPHGPVTLDGGRSPTRPARRRPADARRPGPHCSSRPRPPASPASAPTQAAAYAKEREQFGRPIGMFQAVKHHCANMLVASRAGHGRRVGRRPGGRREPAATELALQPRRRGRRAGGPGRPAERRAQHPGARRHRLHVGARRPPVPAPGHRAAAAFLDADRPRPPSPTSPGPGVAARRRLDLPPEAEPSATRSGPSRPSCGALDGDAAARRLVDTGYFMPHWPKPWGRGAGAVEQLVIDEEFAAAGITPPQLRHHRVGHPHAHPARHRRPGRAVGPADARAGAWCGASCSASPTPGPTPPASGPAPPGSTAAGWSTARRCGPAARSSAPGPRDGAHRPRGAKARGHHHDGRST